MNKKTTVIYVYLALFAFTLGLSFTLASQAQAEPGCCLAMCPAPYNEFPSYHGYLVLRDGVMICTYTGNPPCNGAYQCPEL